MPWYLSSLEVQDDFKSLFMRLILNYETIYFNIFNEGYRRLGFIISEKIIWRYLSKTKIIAIIEELSENACKVDMLVESTDKFRPQKHIINDFINALREKGIQVSIITEVIDLKKDKLPSIIMDKLKTL